MMHVMQPVVLDAGWPASGTTHDAAAANSGPSTPSDVTVAGKTTASSTSFGRSPTNGSTNVVDSQPAYVSTAVASYKTLNQADVFNMPTSLVDRSVDAIGSSAVSVNQPTVTTPAAHQQKPPKRPLTPYMRYSRAVSCRALM